MSMTGHATGPPAWIKPHIDVKLAPGWYFDTSKKAFVSERGDEFAPGEQLPANALIRHTAPGLAMREQSELSPSELNLVSYIQIVFPPGTMVEDYLPGVREWPCISEAREPPRISLP